MLDSALFIACSEEASLRISDIVRSGARMRCGVLKLDFEGMESGAMWTWTPMCLVKPSLLIFSWLLWLR